MKELFGKIRTSLVEKGPERIEELTELINTNIGPPEPVGADEVYIRAMYIVSDRVNSAGGRFPAEDHETLAGLLIDSPVLVGHRKDSLPIARNFHAEAVQKGDEHWIKVYFYWLKKAEGAENLRNNIDGGIYKEGSISFIFGLPECGICGEDIRSCEHRPFRKYVKEGREIEAYFNYRRIFRVLETSLVYRGAVHDTSITGELFVPGNTDESDNSENCRHLKPFTRLTNLEVLNREHRYLVRPLYESIPVIIERCGEGIDISCTNGERLTGEAIDSLLSDLSLPDKDTALEGRLIGFRGKERQPVAELIGFIEGRSSSVKRVELRLCGGELSHDSFDAELKIVPSLTTDGAKLANTVESMKSRLGVEIIDLEDGAGYLYRNGRALSMTVVDCRENGNGYDHDLIASDSRRQLTVNATYHSVRRFNPGECLELAYDRIVIKESGAAAVGLKLLDSYGKYRKADNIDLSGAVYFYRDELEFVQSGTIHYCIVKGNSGTIAYRLNRFDMELFERSRRFLAISVPPDEIESGKVILHRKIKSLMHEDGSVRIVTEGNQNEVISIRRAIINGHKCSLIYRFEGDRRDNE